MKRIAIIGGGIAGVSAAYELARQQQAGAPIDFALFEATSRLGGIVETERREGFVIECGPDSWVTEKPAARDLAIELGLQSELIFSQDERRKTYLAEGRNLQPMPDGMRMMVPVQWASTLDSPLFSWQAKLAYLREPKLAEALKAGALAAGDSDRDESVHDFVLRHFRAEVADTIAAPLLAGVFGGDIASLSARATLPAFVALEREHGSLILGLQRRAQDASSSMPVFTTLQNGLAGLIEGMNLYISAKNVHCGFQVEAIERIDDGWRIRPKFGAISTETRTELPDRFDAVLIATPAKTTAQLLTPLDPRMAELLPQRSSSAIVIALGFNPEQAGSMRIPRGFGFLVPQRKKSDLSGAKPEDLEHIAQRALLACTFVDQKFSHRAPTGAVLLRAFLGGPFVAPLLDLDDATLLAWTKKALERILGRLPEPSITVVRRLPDSLPLYEVGHLARIAELESRMAQISHLQLIGSAYRGVGLPDLIDAGRNAARRLVGLVAASPL